MARTDTQGTSLKKIDIKELKQIGDHMGFPETDNTAPLVIRMLIKKYKLDNSLPEIEPDESSRKTEVTE